MVHVVAALLFGLVLVGSIACMVALLMTARHRVLAALRMEVRPLVREPVRTVPVRVVSVTRRRTSMPVLREAA